MNRSTIRPGKLYKRLTERLRPSSLFLSNLLCVCAVCTSRSEQKQDYDHPNPLHHEFLHIISSQYLLRLTGEAGIVRRHGFIREVRRHRFVFDQVCNVGRRLICCSWRRSGVARRPCRRAVAPAILEGAITRWHCRDENTRGEAVNTRGSIDSQIGKATHPNVSIVVLQSLSNKSPSLESYTSPGGLRRLLKPLPVDHLTSRSRTLQLLLPFV